MKKIHSILFSAVMLMTATATYAQITDGYYKMTANVEVFQQVEGLQFSAENYVKVSVDASEQRVYITSPTLPLISGFEFNDDYCTSAVCYAVGYYPVDGDHNLYIYDADGDYSASIQIQSTDVGFTMDDFIYSIYENGNDTYVASFSNVVFTYLGEEKPDGYQDEDDKPGGDDPGNDDPVNDDPNPEDDFSSVLPEGIYDVTAVLNGQSGEPTQFQFSVVDRDGQKCIGYFLYEADYYSTNYVNATIDTEGIRWNPSVVWDIPAINGSGWEFNIIVLPEDSVLQPVTDNGDGTYTLGDFQTGLWSFFSGLSVDNSYTQVTARLHVDDTTGIRNVHMDKDTKVYNLNGVEVKTPRHGQIVIIGGRSFIVR